MAQQTTANQVLDAYYQNFRAMTESVAPVGPDRTAQVRGLTELAFSHADVSLRGTAASTAILWLATTLDAFDEHSTDGTKRFRDALGSAEAAVCNLAPEISNAAVSRVPIDNAPSTFGL